MLKIVMYFFASGVAALVNFAARAAYNMALNFWLSVVLAYFTGMLVNYLLSRKYVFDTYAGATTRRTGAKFAFVAVLGLGVTTGVSVLALDFLQTAAWLPDHAARGAAHALGIGVAFFASFFGHRFLTFRETGLSKILKGSDA